MESQTAPGRVSRTLFLLLCLLNMVGQPQSRGTAAAAAVPPDCRRWCGAVEVPYPFGLLGNDSRCYLEENFALNCSTPSSPPPKLFWDDLEVINISVYSKATMHVLMPISYSCNNGREILQTNLQGLTATFSYTDNVYFAIGCDTKAYIRGRVESEAKGEYFDFNYTGGCMSSCQSFNQIHDGDCSGIGCCQTSIPKGLWRYNISIESNDDVNPEIVDMNPCSYSFLVQKNNYSFKASDLSGKSVAQRFPVVLDWYVGFSSCERAMKNRTSYACIGSHSLCVNSTNGPGYVCKCSPGYHGNPYISDGCQDVDECQQVPGPCKTGAICINTPGYYTCTCPFGTIDDGYECRKIPHRKAKVAAALGIVVGISFLSLICTFSCLIFQRQKVEKMKRQFFIDNGGERLEGLLSETENGKTCKMYSLAELEKATNSFNEAQVLGCGGFGKVYRGDDSSGPIAIKKVNAVNNESSESFAKEMYFLSKIKHPNIVRLLGWCLEVKVPMLIFEFIPNGTLSYHISKNFGHQGSGMFIDRLKIALQSADAIRYLHNEVGHTIVHGDIKSANILLDQDWNAKVSDFGTARLVPKDKIYCAEIIQGTFGYMDPEYFQTGILTDKSDVYSLGVVLVELLSGKTVKPSQDEHGNHHLVKNFLRSMREDRNFPRRNGARGNGILQILDPQIAKEEGLSKVVLELADLTDKCLNLDPHERPTMKELCDQLSKLADNVGLELATGSQDTIPDVLGPVWMRYLEE